MTAQSLIRSSIVRASQQQVSSQLADEVVILNLQNGSYYSLDEVGALIWNQLQQPCSIEAICAAVMEHYEVDASQCSEDVIALVEDMLSVGMVEVEHVAATSVFEPVSR